MSTLTLSGWTQPSDAVARALDPSAQVFDYSDYQSPEAAFEAMRQFRDVEHVIGWSMGGQLALRAIMDDVLAPKRLTLISTPYQFVRSPLLKVGMEDRIYDTFRHNYSKDPERTSKRFHELVAKGDRLMSEVLSKLRHHPEATNTARWSRWLHELGMTTMHRMDLSMVPDTLIVHGTKDAVVGVEQSQLLAQALPRARLEQWEGVAHAPHLHDAPRLMASMQTMRSAA